MKGLTRVILRLGRNPEAGYPEGDDSHGYVLVAPLTHDGVLDDTLWQAHRGDCTVKRFTPDPDERADGVLSRRGDNWFFHFDGEDVGGDESVFRLGAHRLLPGEYLTVRETDGDVLTYKVTETQKV
jgi:hypothetical protein